MVTTEPSRVNIAPPPPPPPIVSRPDSNRRPKIFRWLRYHSTGGSVMAMSLPTAWSLLNSCLCCSLRPGFGAVLGLGPWFGFGLGSGTLKCLGHEFSSKLKKHYLCMHFLACAIGENLVGTNAWYLLHLCGGCEAHVGGLLQFFRCFTPCLFLCSTSVSHAFPSSHIQAHNSKHE